MTRRAAFVVMMVGVVGVVACGSTNAKPSLVRWQIFRHVRGPVDLAGPRADGALVLAAAGRLRTLSGSGSLSPLAPSYRGRGGEPYIALPAPNHKGCSFGGAVYALKLGSRHGVVAVTHGSVRSFVTLRARGLENGIAFDETGRFAHRLLVTVSGGGRTTVYAINCHGRASTVTSSAPRVEGGIAVAPGGFGSFAGQLIAPDELTGRIYAISPSGASTLIAVSDLPHGQDVGVESEAFVPTAKRFQMLLADRRTPGNPHPGDDVILSLSEMQLARAGVRAGDLLLATEGGAKVDALRCSGSACSVRHVADGPAIAHAEGHIAFLPG